MWEQAVSGPCVSLPAPVGGELLHGDLGGWSGEEAGAQSKKAQAKCDRWSRFLGPRESGSLGRLAGKAHVKEYEVGLGLVPTLPLTSWVLLGKYLTLSVPQFRHQ